MPITSFVVNTLPQQTDSVSEHINALQGTSVTEKQDNKLIVITETTNTEQDRALWSKMEQIQGVVTVDAIYHNFEDLGEG